MQKKLDPEKRPKAMSRYGIRALKWTFERKRTRKRSRCAWEIQTNLHCHSEHRSENYGLAALRPFIKCFWEGNHNWCFLSLFLTPFPPHQITSLPPYGRFAPKLARVANQPKSISLYPLHHYHTFKPALLSLPYATLVEQPLPTMRILESTRCDRVEPFPLWRPFVRRRKRYSLCSFDRIREDRSD